MSEADYRLSFTDASINQTNVLQLHASLDAGTSALCSGAWQHFGALKNIDVRDTEAVVARYTITMEKIE